MVISTSYIVFTRKIIIVEWNLIYFINTNLILTLVLDPIGIIFSSTVIIISANVLSFSSVYISSDKFINRFTILVLLFILSINFLIFIPHIIILLLGWDGLGLVSFILVIYYQNHKSLAAGMITALSNRIGDATLLLAIALTLDQGHWFILNIQPRKFLILQIIFITVAAITKRAQIPFSRWLPAAIAAPTPVSALVHSSTLVTAGVFLLIRFYPFLHTLTYFNTFLLLIATSTIFIAGVRATTECDIKKIIALSTLRQLGIIITSLGLNLPILTFFHITTHALFKALLFIGAGSFINYHHHSQDLRWIGNLRNQIPISSSCITIANLALCGFPFIAGFYSKDFIMEISISSPINELILSIILVRIGLTAFYSIRFSIATILSPRQTISWIFINEEKNINTPILVLSSIATVSGAILIWINPIRNNVPFIPLHIKILPTVLILIGLILGFIVSNIQKYLFSIKNNVNHYARCIIWFLVPLSTQFILDYPLKLAHWNLKIIDHGWIEIPQFLHSVITNSNTSLINYSPIQASQIIISLSHYLHNLY
jgi:NADH-ubiquinone oxidoreductase chain 5